MTQTAILVMAAGSSRRFGTDKRQAKLCNKTILQTTLDSASPWKKSIRVILSPEDQSLQQQLSEQQIITYIAANARQGMGHSLANAIQQLSANEPDINACLVMLADMPYLKTSTLNTLLDALNNHPLVVPTYQGKWGNPVGFGRFYFSELAELSGDKGGKIILRTHKDSVHDVPVDDPGIFKDIDRPEQLENS